MKKITITFLVLGYFFLMAGVGRASLSSRPFYASPLIEQADLPNPSAYNLLNDAQSTTGPTPPPGVEAQGARIASPNAVVLSGAPAYLWRHGCGPTAAGMIIGYWDSHGYDWLIPGSAITQTAQVDEAIASSLGEQNHWTDYAFPVDYSPVLLPDKSEPPVGDEHPDNSIADFMHTSQSYYSNFYGWSWFSDVKRALLGYFDLVNPTGSAAISNNLYYSDGLWDNFRNEINSGRPVVFLVDSDGNSYTDHFITAIGYDMVGDVKQYAALNTWDTSIHWYSFGPLTAGTPWGIFGAVTFSISGGFDKFVYLPGVMR